MAVAIAYIELWSDQAQEKPCEINESFQKLSKHIRARHRLGGISSNRGGARHWSRFWLAIDVAPLWERFRWGHQRTRHAQFVRILLTPEDQIRAAAGH